MVHKSLKLAVLGMAAGGLLTTSISLGSGVASADLCKFTNAAQGPAVEGGLREQAVQGELRSQGVQGEVRSANVGVVQAQGSVSGMATTLKGYDPYPPVEAGPHAPTYTTYDGIFGLSGATLGNTNPGGRSGIVPPPYCR